MGSILSHAILNWENLKDTKQESDHFYLCLREISKVGNNNKLIIERE